MNAPLPRIDSTTLKRRLDDGSVVLIDVREPDEFARERIRGARSAPLSAFEREDFGRLKEKPAVFQCRSGNRTTVNAERLRAAGFREAFELEGGMMAWKQAGLPVELDRSQPIDLMRQVQIAVGLMILIGLGLAVLLTPWFALLSAFAGAGLLTAGLTGFCGMARMLALMPWNRRAQA